MNPPADAATTHCAAALPGEKKVGTVPRGGIATSATETLVTTFSKTSRRPNGQAHHRTLALGEFLCNPRTTRAINAQKPGPADELC
jgi:hypothetical protein